MSNFLLGTIDRFEGNFAVITLGNDQKINWPKSNLNHDYKIGEKIKLVINQAEVNTEDEIEINAKQILNEILQNN